MPWTVVPRDQHVHAQPCTRTISRTADTPGPNTHKPCSGEAATNRPSRCQCRPPGLTVNGHQQMAMDCIAQTSKPTKHQQSSYPRDHIHREAKQYLSRKHSCVREVGEFSNVHMAMPDVINYATRSTACMFPSSSLHTHLDQ